VHVSAGNAEGSVVVAEGLLVGCFEQTVDLTLGVAVELYLTDAELVRPGVAGIVSESAGSASGCTQLLIPELAAEGRAQLLALGCPMPVP
jgi:hypothetical protein